MEKEVFNITTLTNHSGCFDLQFRKDTRHERLNSPTYYRWKVQFIITASKEQINVLKKVTRALQCGKVTVTKGQARFSVQKINDLTDAIIPFFSKNTLADNKKKDFQMWVKAVEIIARNQGKYITTWKKNELNSLIEIHKTTTKYKQRARKAKWMDMATTLAKLN
jgi:hypothetical protein